MDLFEYSKKTVPDPVKKADPEDRILSVSEFTFQMKQLVTSHFSSQPTFWIKGEVCDFKKHQSGHMYFRLKDKDAILSCVFFRHANARSKVQMKEGLSVYIKGKIDVYEKNGNYQMVIDQVRTDGIGDLYQQFEELKKKLEAQGLFSVEKKKSLPKYPRSVAVITSPTGAVIRDIIHVLEKRFPLLELYLFPVKVQGDGSAEEIVEAIQRVHQYPQPIDVIILGRGGGSIEDLWSFNEEMVVRAVFASTIPVVSAVGHQTDFTLCDFAADLRAATPSHAAEMIAPNLDELCEGVEALMKQMTREVDVRLQFNRERLRRFQQSPALANPRNLLNQKVQRFDFAFDRLLQMMMQKKSELRRDVGRLRDALQSRMIRGLAKQRMQVEKAQSNLALVSPLSVLSRGFSIVEKKNKEIVRNQNQVQVQEEVTVRLHEGVLQCQVLKN